MMTKVNVLLEEFHQIAVCPGKQLERYLAEGKKVIGCVPVYTPEEIIHAMGAVPIGLWGGDIEIKRAKEYFPAFICSIMQSVLELGIRGSYQGISAILIPSLCDSLKTLGENWKYAVKSIPFIPMTYPQNRESRGAKEFVLAGYKRVAEDIQAVTGLELDENRLAESIQIYNRHNAAMRRLSDLLAHHSQITAAQRCDIFKSAHFMLKEEHTVMVEAFIEELEKEPMNHKKKIRAITSGILADNRNLLEILDDNDIQIVGDDVAHESRQYRVDTVVDGSAMEGLAETFCHMDHCSVLYDPYKKRVDLIMERAKAEHADVVIILLTKFCDPEEFDYVLIKRSCEEAGIPHLLIEVDRQMTNYEQAKTMIQTIREMMQ